MGAYLTKDSLDESGRYKSGETMKEPHPGAHGPQGDVDKFSKDEKTAQGCSGLERSRSSRDPSGPKHMHVRQTSAMQQVESRHHGRSESHHAITLPMCQMQVIS